MSALAAGSTVAQGRYRLDEVIGRGGMALVWRATDLQLERDVAIKVISDVLAQDPSFVARFEREARLAAALNHPNLVKIFDFSVEGERPYLVMEYVPGGTLVDARGRGLDVATVARDLLDAVTHIHAAGILHRDIKPANVLVNQGGSPRLTDFGIAREETSSLTQTGQVLGTLRYIAPEVADGERATPRSDLYSLGVLLGELPNAPEDVARLAARMAARNPADRPRSAAEALAELDPTRMPPATEALPPATEALPPTEARRADAPRRTDAKPPWQRGGFVVRRVEAIAAAAVLVVVLVIVIIAASSGDGSKPGATATTTVQPAPAGAPVDQQLDQLEKIVRAAPKQ